MNRRDLFKGIIGVGVVAPVIAKAAVEARPIFINEIYIGGESPHSPPVFTAKQQEVINALTDPEIRYVLFSGGRVCGKTFVAKHIARKCGSHCVAVLPNTSARNYWISTMRHGVKATVVGEVWGFRYSLMIMEDTHEMLESKISRALMMADFEGKILFTSLVHGPGTVFLRKNFPSVGRCGPHHYHVNASMFDNPYFMASLEDRPELNPRAD